MRMRRIVLSSMACLAVLCVFHIISKSVDDFERKLLDMKCVFDFFYKFALNHFSVEKEFGDIKS
jgi:hypothetical protein